MRRSLSFWNVVGLWLLFFPVPWFFIDVGLKSAIDRQENQARDQIRNDLLTEARVFQVDLQLKDFFQRKCAVVSHEFGFDKDPDPEAAKGSAVVSSELFAKLRSSLEKACKTPILGLALYGPKGHPCMAVINPEFPVGSSRADGTRRFSALVHRIAEQYRPSYRLDQPKDLHQELMQESGSLFGPDGDLTVMIPGGADFISWVDDFDFAFWTHGRFPLAGKEAVLERYPNFLVIFHGRHLKAETFVSHAIGLASPGFRRQLKWLPFDSRDEFKERANGLGYFEALEESSFKKLLFREKGAKIVSGLRPVLNIEVDAKLWSSSLRKWQPLLHLGFLLGVMIATLVFGRRLFLGGGLPGGLRVQLAAGFALCVGPTLFGLSLLTYAWLDARLKALPGGVKSHIERRIELLDNRVQKIVDDETLMLRTLKPVLNEVLQSPGAAGNNKLGEILASSTASSTLDFGFVFNFQGEASQHFNRLIPDPNLVKLFSTFAPRVLAEASRASEEARIEPKSNLFWRGFAEQFMEVSALGRAMARSEILQRSPFGNPQQWVDVFFLRDPKAPGLVTGMAVLMGLYRFVEFQLYEILKFPEFRETHFDGYALDLLCYKFSHLSDRNIQSNHLTTNPGGPEWDEQRRVADATLKDLVGKNYLELSSTGTRVIVSRPIHSDYFVVVGVGTDTENRTLGMAKLLLFLAVTIFFLFVSILAATSFVLTRPLSPFLKATRLAVEADFSWRLELPLSDEFGQMGAVFNQMAERLIERQRLSRFVSEEILCAIEEDGESALKRGGSSVVTTVLVSDIRDFTTLSERHPPEVIVAMLNDYFSVMEECICSQGGIIVSFIGDAVLAHFPVDPRHQLAGSFRAVNAAIRMREALDAFNQNRLREGVFTIRTGIGIASGNAITGVVGSQNGRLGQTILGEVVDRATALESASKRSIGTGIMLDPLTASCISKAFRVHKNPNAEALEILEIPSEY